MAMRTFFGKIKRWQVIAVAVAMGLFGAHTLIYSPWTNPSPTQVYQIYGAFPYSKGYDLDLRATYVSSNPWCKKTLRAFFFFEAAKVNRSVDVDLDVMRKPGDEYMASIALDHFKPGLCGWQYAGLFYGFRGNRLSGSRYVALGPVSVSDDHAELICREKVIRHGGGYYISCFPEVGGLTEDIPDGVKLFNFWWGVSNVL
jgi:hypothetical protein